MQNCLTVLNQHHDPHKEPISDVALSYDVMVTLSSVRCGAARLHTTAKPHTTTCRTRIEEAMAGDEMRRARRSETVLRRGKRPAETEAQDPTADSRVRRRIGKRSVCFGKPWISASCICHRCTCHKCDTPCDVWNTCRRGDAHETNKRTQHAAECRGRNREQHAGAKNHTNINFLCAPHL